MNSDCKVFVGNVPFKCNIEEFNDCFKNMNGFIKAELCSQNNDDSSRGFGFLIFDTPENAKAVLNLKNIKFMDRELRFHPYNFENVKKISLSVSNDLSYMSLYNNILNNKNYIHISKLPPNTAREDLKKIFSKYGKIGKYFLMTDQKTGMLKNTAIVEIIENDIFEFLINKKAITYNNHILEFSKWKLDKPIKITTKKNKQTNKWMEKYS